MTKVDFYAKNRQKQTVEIDIELINERPGGGERCSGEEFGRLLDSVTKNSIISPLTVRRNGSRYDIIDGERRLYSAKLCGISAVPCYVCEMNERNFSILLLVEDIKRRGHSIFEEAEMIESLITSFGMTQEDAAQRLGRAQSTVANKLRLLRLTQEERKIIVEERLTERHARALLRLGSSADRLEILRNIAENHLNVEQTEVLIDRFIGTKASGENVPQRGRVLHDIVVFINIFNKMLDSAKNEGIRVDSEKIEDKSFLEYRVRVPLDMKNS